MKRKIIYSFLLSFLIAIGIFGAKSFQTNAHSTSITCVECEPNEEYKTDRPYSDVLDEPINLGAVTTGCFCKFGYARPWREAKCYKIEEAIKMKEERGTSE